MKNYYIILKPQGSEYGSYYKSSPSSLYVESNYDYATYTAMELADEPEYADYEVLLLETENGLLKGIDYDETTGMKITNIGTVVPYSETPVQPPGPEKPQWGEIAGNMSAQTDLQEALDTKASKSDDFSPSITSENKGVTTSGLVTSLGNYAHKTNDFTSTVNSGNKGATETDINNTLNYVGSQLSSKASKTDDFVTPASSSNQGITVTELGNTVGGLASKYTDFVTSLNDQNLGITQNDFTTKLASNNKGITATDLSNYAIKTGSNRAFDSDIATDNKGITNSTFNPFKSQTNAQLSDLSLAMDYCAIKSGNNCDFVTPIDSENKGITQADLRGGTEGRFFWNNEISRTFYSDRYGVFNFDISTTGYLVYSIMFNVRFSLSDLSDSNAILSTQGVAFMQIGAPTGPITSSMRSQNLYLSGMEVVPKFYASITNSGGKVYFNLCFTFTNVISSGVYATAEVKAYSSDSEQTPLIPIFDKFYTSLPSGMQEILIAEPTPNPEE